MVNGQLLQGVGTIVAEIAESHKDRFLTNAVTLFGKSGLHRLQFTVWGS